MTVPAPSDRDRLPALITELLDVATTFVELAYLSAGGGLTLALPMGSVRGIRLEVPAGGALHLRGLEIDADGRADIAAVSRLLTSDAADGVDPAVLGRLLEPDGSRATVLRCGPDGGPAWVEIRFSLPVDVRRITLKEVPYHLTCLLWDSRARKIISFREYRQQKARGASLPA